MELVLVGLNHHTADVALREKLAISPEQARDTTRALLVHHHLREAVVLSTCNRTEVTGAAAAPASAIQRVHELLAARGEVPESELRRHTYTYQGSDAIRHLFRVAASLDSLVVGEPQILKQMKDAYHIAVEARATGALTNKLFHRAFAVGKRVRAETAIAENAVSVGYVAVELAREIFMDLSERSALLVGAGEMAELAARHLLSSGIRCLTVANRSLANAVRLAEEFHGRAVDLSGLERELLDADVVIASAGSPSILIGRPLMERVARARKYRPIFFIDIALPRNIAADVAQVEGCYLYGLDDLDKIVARNLQNRHVEARKAEEIVLQEAESFPAYLKSLRVVPAIRQLQNKYEAIRRAELERVLGKSPELSPELRQKIDYLTVALVKKFLHDPITLLKREDAGATQSETVELAQRLFGLENQDPSAAAGETAEPQDQEN